MTARALLMSLALVVGCGGGDELAPPASAPPATVEEQYRLALAGAPDAEVAAVAAAIEERLAADERDALASLDFADTPAPDLLRHQALMRAWGVIVIELAGMGLLHAVDHPGCDVVQDTLEGWCTAAGATAFDVAGTSIPGASAPAAVLFVAKKSAQTFRAPIHLPFDHANACAAELEPEGGCGTPGEACCDGTCNGGTTCVGGLCL
jgi:hypothetical protein